MIRDMDGYDDPSGRAVSRRIVETYVQRTKWLRRHIAVIDLSEGMSTWVLKQTFDIDVGAFCKAWGETSGSDKNDSSSDDHVYVPLSWRTKAKPYLAVDTCTADGRRLRIMSRSFNSDFSVEYFRDQVERNQWNRRCGLGYVEELSHCSWSPEVGGASPRNEIVLPEDVVAEIRESSGGGSEVSGIGQLREQKGDECAAPVILFDHLCEMHSQIVRVPKGVDFSIIKLWERFFLSTGSPSFWGNPLLEVSAFTVPFDAVKVVVPDDLRLQEIALFEHTARDDNGNSVEPISPEIEGDGSWGIYYQKGGYRSNGANGGESQYVWSLGITPRRRHFLGPAILVSALLLVSQLYQAFRQTFVVKGGLGGNDVSSELFIAVLIFTLGIVWSSRKQSVIYDRIIFPYRIALLAQTLLCSLFVLAWEQINWALVGFGHLFSEIFEKVSVPATLEMWISFIWLIWLCNFENSMFFFEFYRHVENVETTWIATVIQIVMCWTVVLLSALLFFSYVSAFVFSGRRGLDRSMYLGKRVRIIKKYLTMKKRVLQ